MIVAASNVKLPPPCPTPHPSPDDPQLPRHAAQAIAKHSRRGWRIDSGNRTDNIDAIIALAMAVDRAEHKPAEVELLGWV